MQSGCLLISLDFELHWGVRDHLSVAAYRDNLLGARFAIPRILAEFEKRGIHATWATVGMLMARDREHLLSLLPERRPKYHDLRLSPYEELSNVGRDEADDPYHFAPSLVSKIVATPGQELASHTFSHYYCLEPGQTSDDFEADIIAARRMMSEYGVNCSSIVFPRNQFNPSYVSVLGRLGISTYRSNPPNWMYQPRPTYRENLMHRGARLLDAYLPLVRRTAVHSEIEARSPLAIPASTFLRPYSPRLRAFERLRLARILDELKLAARERQLLHIWWHPHNFGRHLDENMAFLRAVLDRFETLRGSHGMQSVGMAEYAASCAVLNTSAEKPRDSNQSN